MKTRRSVKSRLFVEELEGRLVPSAYSSLPEGASLPLQAVNTVPSLVGHSLAVVAKSNAPAATTASTSSNWSGYAVTTKAGAVTNVSGAWVVPAVTGTGNTYSSVWVGIDGYNSSTVEQIGTEQDISNGKPVYYAWYEMYPSGSVEIMTIKGDSGDKIQPNDTIHASVTYNSSGSFTLTITDTPTSGTGFTFTTIQTTQKHASAQRSSAEWIVEAPSSGRVLPLANFGMVTFSAAMATINGTTGPITGPIDAWPNYSINMVSRSGTEDTTSSLNSTGDGFTETFDPLTPASTSPSPHHRDSWWYSGRQAKNDHAIRDMVFASPAIPGLPPQHG